MESWNVTCAILDCCEARHVTIEQRNHNSIMFKAIAGDDPVGRAVVQFVRQHVSR